MSKQNKTDHHVASTTPGSGVTHLAHLLPVDPKLIEWLDRNAQSVCNEKHNVTDEEG